MWRFCAAALAVLMLVPAARGQDETEKKVEPPTPAQQYAQLMSEFRESRQALSADYQKANAEERQALMEKSVTQINEFADKFLELATAHSEDPVAANAFRWIFQYAGMTPTATTAAKALLEKAAKDPSSPQSLNDMMTVATRTRGEAANEATKMLLDVIESKSDDPSMLTPLTALLTGRAIPKAITDKAGQILLDNFVDKDDMKMVCMRLAQGVQNRDLLRQVSEKTTNDAVKGHALFAMANALLGRPIEPNKEAEELLTRVVNEFGDIESFRGTLGKMAAGPLFEMQHLQIGMHAPNIEGTDIDDEPFQLADYKGKVVVLDFWGDW